MKKSLFVMLPALMLWGALTAQNMKFANNDYPTEWKEIEKLEGEGLPKSALEKVEALFKRAQTDKNPSQIVKTLVYRAKYTTELDEDGFVKAVNNLHSEMDAAQFPVKNVLQSMLGELYAGYLESNVWRMRGRTTPVAFKTDDIRTWTIAQLNDEAALLYRLSLNDETARQVLIANFSAVTTEGSDNLRPTLYDFLAHRAVDFFRDDKSYLAKPNYKFELDTEGVFSPAEDFVKQSFESRDSASGKLWALRVLQDIIRFHLDDKEKDALIDADLKRLEFVRENSVLDNKDDFYQKALETLREKHKDNAAYAEITLKLAHHHRDMASKWKATPNNPYRLRNKMALDMSRDAVNRYKKAYGSNGLRALIDDILTPSVEIRTEEVVPPNKPILASVSFKNADSLHYKIIRLYDRTSRREFEDESERLKFYNNQPFVARKTVKLPNDGDFNPHLTELKIEKLPLGMYLVLASDNSRFSNKSGGKVAYMTFNVSNIAYFHRNGDTEANQFVVVDRSSGQALSGVTVEFWESKYNAQTRKDIRLKIGNAVSDREGFVFPRLPKEKYYTMRFIYGKDTLATGDGYSNYFYKPERQVSQHTHFFLDRAIYRPSQTVFYKGILIEKSENTEGGTSPKIVPNQEVEVTFFDANSQKIASNKLTTNEFGTFNGSFVAPSSGLLGHMSISSSLGGAIGFRVEEYKRPKFEVKIEPLDGSYVLDQNIVVNGVAKAFAGSNIDGAMVKYRVVREVRFPYWKWGWFPPYDTEGAQEIAHGETKTDAKGNFIIEFKALPNRRTSKDQKPVFDYAIYADVTDQNGETRSTKGSVSIGYTSSQAAIDVEEETDKRNTKPLKIITTNLNGQPLVLKGSVKIDLLTSPRRPYIPRYWSVPDTHVLEEIAFRRDFPLYAYRDEDKEQNWVVKRTQLEQNFETKLTSSVIADIVIADTSALRKWQSGAYRMTVTTIDPTTNEKIETVKHFLLYDRSEDIVPCNKTFFAWLNKPNYEPNETAVLTIGTASEVLNVLIEEELNGKLIKKEWLPFTMMQDYVVKLTEASRGNHFIHLSYAFDNRASFETKTLVVPYSNKELNIEYQTFRDKMLPASEEEWRLKISGKDKEKVAAEMVAAMYDASLDQFAPNHWFLSLYPMRSAYRTFDAPTFGEAISTPFYDYTEGGNPSEDEPRLYRNLNWFGLDFGGNRGRMRGGQVMYSMAMDAAPAPRAARPAPQAEQAQVTTKDISAISRQILKSEKTKSPYTVIAADVDKNGNVDEEKQVGSGDFSQVKARTNLNETVFFFPNLMTDADGNVVVKFTMNEALTKWKFLALAHTTDLKVGLSEKTVQTQKDLMVFPNAPRFLREGDAIQFSGKVSNLTSEILRGQAKLELLDALTLQPIDDLLGNKNPVLDIEIKGGESTPLMWDLQIPIGKVQAVTYRIVAKAGNFSDGEEAALPVLTNRMLVTESLPLSIRGGATKTFTFESLKKSSSSNTLTHNGLTLEMTQNPAWYAVQALPYLMEYPYDCTEQIFSRYYANALATNVANSTPKIKAVFERWKNVDVAALQSNLSKNQELKTALLEETPWVLDAQREEVQKKNIGLLFDLNKMANESTVALRKMTERQLSNGGFAWFPGGQDSWYITQYITEGVAHLNALGVGQDGAAKMLSDKAMKYCDDRFSEHYAELKKMVERGQTKFENDNLSSIALHYLYVASFDTKRPIADQTAFDYYLSQAEKFWTKRGIYEQGLIALTCKRLGKTATTDSIIKSLKERAQVSEEMGMYWKRDWGYRWHELPIENQSLMIELFNEVGDAEAVDNLKVWLLKNKQTNAWKTTKATASAVYALLKTGANWLEDDAPIAIQLGGKELDQSQIQKEAGTGYFKTKFDKSEISAKMADVKVQNPNKVVAWGGLYWQYFEQLDKIKDFRETPLTIKKQLFKQIYGDKGAQLAEITEGGVSVGDKLKVRIELRVDRDMEFVHMKDMRAAGFEPTNVLSSYKWQDGLGYYESTRDAATNFFFDYLPKGTYVFEYPLVVNHKGDMSNGITTIQCMYAPEFSSHSEGVRVKVR